MLAHVTLVSCWLVSEDHTLIYEQVAYEPNLVLRYVHHCPHACQKKCFGFWNVLDINH